MTRYLLLPMQPTPNGRMHIGHGGGTYLRTDVVARYLRSRGHDVTTISGSDAHENWVLAEAARSGMGPFEVCARYHAAIREDLEGMGAQLDTWIDPLSEDHADAYRSVHENNLKDLRHRGVASLDDERVPVSAATGEPMMGTWIAGGCPSCGADAGGSSCVRCGDHFQPEELVSPRSRLDDSALEWKTVRSWFAHPRDRGRLLSSIHARGLREAFAAPAVSYVATKGGRVRLSGPGTWGIASDLIPASAVLMNSYYLYAVYGADVYRRDRHLAVNPFHPSSDVITVGFFGSDNTTPGVIVPMVLAQGSPDRLRPFDHVVVNGMLHYEGQKCSTSKRHGIWLGEILSSGLVTSDELRFALSLARLDLGADDITLMQLADRVNLLRTVVVPAIQDALYELRVGDQLHAKYPSVATALERQDEALTLDRLNTVAATDLLIEWARTRLNSTAPEWLVGMALLTYPIAPELALQLWAALGLAGEPSVTVAATSSVSRAQLVHSVNSSFLDMDALRPYVHQGVSA